MEAWDDEALFRMEDEEDDNEFVMSVYSRPTRLHLLSYSTGATLQSHLARTSSAYENWVLQTS